jgi:hypothetical protein
MKEVELCDYGYLPGRPVQERRLAIEHALLNHDFEDVFNKLKVLQSYHPNVMVDVSEINQYAEDVLYLKDVLLVEQRHKDIKHAREQVLCDYGGVLGRKRISFGNNRESFRKINKK